MDDCGFIGNGLQFVAPEEIAALTDSFIFVDNDENYYWNPDYQVQLEIEELRDKGELYFKKAD